MFLSIITGSNSSVPVIECLISYNLTTELSLHRTARKPFLEQKTTDIKPDWVSHVLYRSRMPGLVDRVFVVHAGSRGLTPTGGTSPNNFSNPTDKDIGTQ